MFVYTRIAVKVTRMWRICRVLWSDHVKKIPEQFCSSQTFRRSITVESAYFAVISRVTRDITRLGIMKDSDVHEDDWSREVNIISFRNYVWLNSDFEFPNWKYFLPQMLIFQILVMFYNWAPGFCSPRSRKQVKILSIWSNLRFEKYFL